MVERVWLPAGSYSQPHRLVFAKQLRLAQEAPPPALSSKTGAAGFQTRQGVRDFRTGATGVINPVVSQGFCLVAVLVSF